ncbi:AfsR/SARP family transcriptional regulator [Millisia brevis]|uniref:AfsR/SARP family transcriptional regulator n=1 Tax=Millisia brevis TaxID=264148 RepID=UPI00082F929A|nr:BTAD domain-containing putative transcriptional regulator [Millisia brevis]
MPTAQFSTISSGADHPSVVLLGGFGVRVGQRMVVLPKHSRRVLAYLCLDKTAEADCDRGVLAERLWPDSSCERSRACLRTALWRIRRECPDLIRCESDRVMVADDVAIDVHRYRRQAELLLAELEDRPRERAHLMARSGELLPGWDETWLLLAREQLRQLRLHALERSGRWLAGHGRFPEAIDVMLIVVTEEPLRETAQATLIEAHLREGNVIEARRQFGRFAQLLWSELGLRPSAELSGRVSAVSPQGVSAVDLHYRVRR